MTVDLDTHLPAIAAGDADAFGRWLAGAERPLRATLRSFATVVDTEAVLQEALLRTWQVAAKVRTDDRPNALLRVARRIAKNHAIDVARRRRVDPVTLAELERVGPAIDPVEPDPHLRAALAACRERLPPAPGRALTARLEARGCTHDRDVAATVEMTLNTFLKNVGRARKLMIDCLASAGVMLEAL